MQYDVIIIGAGPGGIFSAYELSKLCPDKKIAVFEEGQPLEKRRCPIDGKTVKHCIGLPGAQYSWLGSISTVGNCAAAISAAMRGVGRRAMMPSPCQNLISGRRRSFGPPLTIDRSQCA